MKNYNEANLERDLTAMQEDVPPMPEHLHGAWMERIAQEQQAAPLTARKPVRTYIARGLAAAAAVIFVAAGATMTADLTPMTAGDTAPASYKQSSAYGGGANGFMLYGSRSMDAVEDGAAYDDGVMLAEETENTSAAIQERKIISSVSLTISTEGFPDALEHIKNACTVKGGWVESISESGEEGNRRAWMTLRVPSDALDTFLQEVGGTGRVTDRNESAQDVTNTYYDTKARLESQQALLDRLHELVAMAETLDDILSLESQIADTQYQIDRLQESLIRTDRQVDYATVDISLREATPADQAADTELSFGQRVAAALKTSGEVFAGFIENAAIWLVSAIPFAAVVAAIWLIWRIIRRKRK